MFAKLRKHRLKIKLTIYIYSLEILLLIEIPTIHTKWITSQIRSNLRFAHTPQHQPTMRIFLLFIQRTKAPDSSPLHGMPDSQRSRQVETPALLPGPTTTRSTWNTHDIHQLNEHKQGIQIDIHDNTSPHTITSDDDSFSCDSSIKP